jgi:hypothetical protein
MVGGDSAPGGVGTLTHLLVDVVMQVCHLQRCGAFMGTNILLLSCQLRLS